MSPVRTSLELFDKVGMPALRARSERLTGYLAALIEAAALKPITGQEGAVDGTAGRVSLVTPTDPGRRGCQLSLWIGGVDAAELSDRLSGQHGVVTDAREPDIVRMAPVPLYSSYHDCWRAADALAPELTA
jgi:kynureninase